jgi:hypothetical protein
MHELLSFLPQGPALPIANIWILVLIILALCSIVLKGFALWYSARAGQKKWFVALILVNTAGILEIIYLVWFRPKNLEELVVVPLSKDSESVPS